MYLTLRKRVSNTVQILQFDDSSCKKFKFTQRGKNFNQNFVQNRIFIIQLYLNVNNFNIIFKHRTDYFIEHFMKSYNSYKNIIKLN